jgi:hypothetical protein
MRRKCARALRADQEKTMKYLTTVAFVLSFTPAGIASAQSENMLVTFTGSNGSGPYTGLIEDGKGHFYGATINGGANGSGAVYELRGIARGKWKETILYSFGPGGSGDGAYPQMPWLAMDKHGALYGTTPNGGAYSHGMVFKLTRGKPQWKEEILYSFTGSNDGDGPIGGVTLDSNGNVYGTTNIGGGSANCASGCGVVFELNRGKHDVWTETVLHAFTGIPQGANCSDDYDGGNPYRATLAIDAAGKIFGTTSAGGNGCGSFGTVWELSPAGGGAWNYSILHDMGAVPGDAYPDAGGVLDSQDNFYFDTGGGNIFELVASQGWQEEELYQYPGPGDEDDYDTVSFDSAGNLYYTSASAGGNGYAGTVEKLTPDGQGNWSHSTLYTFPDNGALGNEPLAGVMVDASGNVYGTCSTGGTDYGDQGTAFEITQ